MKQKPLFTVDGETLTTTLLPPVRFVVEGFLPQGLHLLAGASKIGKSWLALWLCLQVAKGEKVWDFPSRSGDVLYLCLEDNYSRIQSRLLDITDEAPGNLHFATASEKLRCGLEQQIQQFLAGHPHTVLVVIDTLQRVRGAGGDANAYANDYRDLEALKALADGNHLAILLVHHLRKREDEDPMNMISGTMGISGATDSNFVLPQGQAQLPDRHPLLYRKGYHLSGAEALLRFPGPPLAVAGRRRPGRARPHRPFSGSAGGISPCQEGVCWHRHRAFPGAGALDRGDNPAQRTDEALDST